MADNRTMAQMLKAPIEGYEDAIVKPNKTFNEAWERFKYLIRQCPHHGFSELHHLDTFYIALNPKDQDALDSAAGGNFLDKILRKCLSIIESKLKVRYSRSRITDVRANTNAPLSSSSPSNSFDLQQIAASLEDKLDIRMNRFKKSLNDMKNSFVTPTTPLKPVEEYLTIQCGDIPSIKKVEKINKIDFINAGEIDFESEEIENFLNDDSIPFGVKDSLFNVDEDILFLKSLLRENPIPPHPIIPNQIKLPIEEPNTKNLIPIPHECEVVLKNGSQSTEPLNDNSLIFTTISNPLFDNDKINFYEINSHVESNSDEFASNHDTVKSDYLDEFMDLSFLSTFLRKKEPGGNMQITSTEWRCCSQSTYVLIIR
nr:putative athila retroelement ORF1 protein [Tanacetum cinerariifolium]